MSVHVLESICKMKSILLKMLMLFIKIFLFVFFTYSGVQSFSYLNEVDIEKRGIAPNSFKILTKEESRPILTDYFIYKERAVKSSIYENIEHGELENNETKISYELSRDANIANISVILKVWDGDRTKWFYYEIQNGVVKPKKYRETQVGYMFASMLISMLCVSIISILFKKAKFYSKLQC